MLVDYRICWYGLLVADRACWWPIGHVGEWCGLLVGSRICWWAVGYVGGR